MSIQTLRDGSEGIVAKIIVGLIIIVFALFGFGSITTFLSPVPKVASVNGDDITQQEMEIAVERNRRLLLAQGSTPSEINEDTLRKDVLQNLINRKLLVQAADDLDLHYADARLDQEIVQTPAFQIDNVFNADQFQMIISGAGYTPLTYREEMRTDKKLQQLALGVQGSAFLPESEIKRLNSLAQQKRDIAWLRVNVSDLMETVTVSESEVEDYYRNHQAEFMTEETVDIAYLEVRRSDLIDQVEVTDADLEAWFEEMKEVFQEQEERRLAHILIEVNDEIDDEAARGKVEAIVARIQAGENFSDIAKEVSEDPGSAAEGGDLGFNPAGTFVPEFEDAASRLTTNQMSSPVRTEFGYHLIKLLDLRPARMPALAEVRDNVEREYREAQAEEAFVALSSRLGELAFEAEDLEGPAQELGLEIKRTGHVGRTGSAGIAADPGVMETAFSADVLIDGNNSRLLEIDPNHHVAIRVAEHRAPVLQPLEDVASAVRERLKREQATTLAESRAKEMVEMLEGGSITRFVADTFGLTWQTAAEVGRNQPGVDREITMEAFKLPRPPVGSKSVGYSVLGNGDAVVLSITRVVNPPQDDIQIAELRSLRAILESRQGAGEFEEFRERLVSEGSVSRN